MKLLLHTCCAPCSVQCVGALAEEGIQPDLYWYNPNIHPYTEYRSRRDTLRNFADERKLFLIMEDDYGLRAFIKGVSSIEEGAPGEAPGENPVEKSGSGARPGCARPRCAYCYRLRLEKTAGMAAEKGYDAFSTSLLISPYQYHDLIRETGEEMASRYGVRFLYRDFRPRFRQGQSEARAAGYYMQKYCGCIYSEEERYLGETGKRSPRPNGK